MKNVKLTKLGGKSALLITSLLLTPLYGHSENSYHIPEGQAKTGVQQQTSQLTGVVLDKDGLPLIGVNIMENTTNGTITDADGKFSIQVTPQSVLHVSYVGFVTQTIKVGNQKSLSITLLEDMETLEEVVVVGYGSQKKVSVTGAVAAIQTKELKQSSAANLSTALAGRLPGLTALQTSGQPGGDDVTLYLRGASTTNGTNPLILIDGVPRDNISTLDPNEIASVSILKDASATAVFGVRGANGVIMITTRRGEVGKTELSISADYSLQQFTASADRIHSWEFAELRNQAFRNDGYSGDDLPYTDYMIDMYKSGKDPVFYPDRDVYGDFFKNWAPQTRINVNMSGGTDKLSYFMNAAYLGQGGQFRTESEKDLGYDPSYKTNRYNFRANLDYKVASNLKLSLNLASYLEKVNTPQTRDLFENSVAGMIQNMRAYIWATPPTDPGPLTAEGYTTPEGKVVPAGQVINQSGQDRNTYGEVNRRGYQQQTNTNLNSSLILDWGLDFITKGLSTKFMISFDSKAQTTLQGVRSYDAYGVSVARTPDEQSYYTEVRVNQNDAISLSKSMATNYYMNMQYSLNYARKFGLHDITGMALVQRDNWQKYEADLPYNLLGVSARATYAYDSRYLGEVNIGYNGSEQFAKGHRFGFFPAFSAGWVVSNEDFMKENKVISNLKLRASYGKVGNDKFGSTRFLYLSSISLGDAGVIPSLGRGKYISQGKLGNTDLSWEIAYKQNYGVDIQFLKEFSVTFDYFKEKREGVLISRGTVPELQGVALENLPKVNMGIIDNHGYEMEATYNKRLNSDWSFTVKGNFAYNKNTQRFMDEAKKTEDYAYQYRNTGYSIGQCFGYKIDYSNGNGYINTQEELDKALNTYQVGGTPRLGDFVYVDVNEDGVINEKDMAPIKYSDVPRITYGFSGTLNWKDFDFSFLFSGIAKASRLYSGWGATEFGLVGFYSDYHLQAWTAERYANGEEIKYPALASSPGTSQKANDFFIMDRSFLRLKNVELGYTLPKTLLKKVGINSTRIYVNGNNLLTWKAMKTDAIDPEQSAELNYPITKMVNFGINVTF
ncbi:TonB-dependent receptor [Parabacteroides sp. AM08-6]|uniref:SusC/RagA family TonB-linked outer membrane protein n=1 Tax=Parabacteroides sp. AM08-6 TaxID=2292053 RepID=UPI000EFE1CDE|nr:TonB-dependent receptor [Parabacteroides sp. AM08-6]RHJ85494.1 TonB-dependent receptor [Parabacteroides sp. AM08-6]